MEPYTGQIKLVPYDFAPANWAFCDGRLVPIRENTFLFELLGTRFGGNGIDTFALPDLRGRCPVGASEDWSQVLLGQTGGHEQVQLSTNQVPSVSAQIAIPVNTATPANPVDRGFSQVPSENCLLSPTTDPEVGAAVLLYGPPQGPGKSGTLRPFSTTTAAGDTPLDLHNPFLGLNFIICMKGNAPPTS